MTCNQGRLICMDMKKPTHIAISSTEMELFKRVKEQLDSDTYRYKSLDLLAKNTGISLTTLKKGFKLLYGIGIYHYLLQLRINKAKKLLLQNDLSVKAVASECGFRNSKHFITTFKKWTGVSPGKYNASIP